MKQIPNQLIEREILSELRRKYIDEDWTDRAKGIHLTNLMYCLTRSWYGFTDPLPVSDREVLLFSIGFGLEAVLLRDGSRIPAGCCEGIHYSPDFIPLGGSKVGELKTTRMSSAKTVLPTTWIDQMMGYCYAEGVTECDLVVLHIVGSWKPTFPEVKGWHFEFTQIELNRFWADMQLRKGVLTEALVSGTPPTPYKWCQDWECTYGPCRYEVRCKAWDTAYKNNLEPTIGDL